MVDPLAHAFNGFEDVAAVGSQKVVANDAIRRKGSGGLERPPTVEVDIGDACCELIGRPAEVASGQDRDTGVRQQTLAELVAGGDAARPERACLGAEIGNR